MKKHTSIWVDEGENGLRLDDADEDGIFIVENEGENKVYVYFSEVKRLVGCLQEKLYEYNNK